MYNQLRHLTLLGSFSLLLTLASALAADEPKAELPTAAQQKETAAVLEEVYELSAANTKAKKQELVPKLMSVAKDAVKEKDTAQLYGILQAIFPLVRDTGDVTTFLTAMQMLTEHFAVDAAQGGQRLDEFLDGCDSSAAFEVIAGELLPKIEQIVRLNRLEQADGMLTVVEKHAQRISTTTPATQQKLKDVKKSVRDRGVAFKAYSGAVNKLAADSEDPQANFIAGAWLAAFEDDWTAALPKLAKGSNPQWKSAAEAELQVSRITDEQAKMAGLWWDIANGMSAESSTKRAVQKHAYDWYTRVVMNISNSLLKTVVERRIKELQPAVDKVAAKPQPTPNNSSPGTSSPAKGETETKLPIGEPIDLLSMIKLPDHVVEGGWRTIDGALVCDASLDARVMAPVVLSRNYEVRLDFTRNAGTESINLVCPIGDTSCLIQVSGWGGKYAGLSRLDGKESPDIKDKQAVISPANIENGKSYTLQVNLQESRRTATIHAALNGRQFVSWRGSVDRLSTFALHDMPSVRSVGILVYKSTATIHGFSVTVTRGGEGYRLQDDWKNPLDVVADTPHRDVAKECAVWNGRHYYFAPTPMSYSSAQRLAAMRQGRLLTISTSAENEFVYQQGKGRRVWMAGWRGGSSNVWRDERNRPLRMFDWDSRQPDNARGRQLRLMTQGTNPRWDDNFAWSEAYACIEWGEEYP